MGKAGVRLSNGQTRYSLEVASRPPLPKKKECREEAIYLPIFLPVLKEVFSYEMQEFKTFVECFFSSLRDFIRPRIISKSNRGVLVFLFFCFV